MNAPGDPSGKWRLSTQEALLLFFFAAIAVVGLCGSVALRRKRIPVEQAEDRMAGVPVPNETEDVAKNSEGESAVSGWEAFKKALAGPRRWSEGRSEVVEEGGGDSWKDNAERRRWDGHGGTTSISPLWQRKILMGERCELPRFSGLILYDEHGLPLRSSINSSSSKGTSHQQAKPAAAAVVTTLKDLL